MRRYIGPIPFRATWLPKVLLICGFVIPGFIMNIIGSAALGSVGGVCYNYDQAPAVATFTAWILTNFWVLVFVVLSKLLLSKGASGRSSPNNAWSCTRFMSGARLEPSVFSAPG